MADESKDASIASSSRKIDLSVGLESVSPTKAKRGSVDLSAGLERVEPTESKINGIPSKIMSVGLERQLSQEDTHQGENIALSPEQVMSLLQTDGEIRSGNTEAWEVKALGGSHSVPNGDNSDANTADILSQLGFSGLSIDEAEGEETWEKKATSGESCASQGQEGAADFNAEEMLAMLGVSADDEGREVWERKSEVVGTSRTPDDA